METQVQGKSQSGQVKSAKNYFQRTEVGERDGGEGGRRVWHQDSVYDEDQYLALTQDLRCFGMFGVIKRNTNSQTRCHEDDHETSSILVHWVDVALRSVTPPIVPAAGPVLVLMTRGLVGLLDDDR